MACKSKSIHFSAMALVLGLFLASALPVQAAQTEMTREKAGILTGSSIAGAVLGGPIGFVLGVAAGDWLGDSVNIAAESEIERERMQQESNQLRDELTLMQNKLDQVREQLLLAQQESGRYQGLALDSLQITVMFNTAGDTLTERDKNRLNRLVRLLNKHGQVQIQLTGYADPRGEEGYNIKLSERRAQSVYSYLVGQGIAGDRIFTSGKGALQSQATKGNYDAYAMERVVTIELREDT